MGGLRWRRHADRSPCFVFFVRCEEGTISTWSGALCKSFYFVQCAVILFER